MPLQCYKRRAQFSGRLLAWATAQFAMQLFPRNCYRFPRLQILHTPRYLSVPGILNGLASHCEAVKQRIGQRGALIHWKRQGSLPKIGKVQDS